MSDFQTWYKIDSAFNSTMEVGAEATDQIGSFISGVFDAFKAVGSVAGPVGIVRLSPATQAASGAIQL
jgi:hypothetical protein